MTYKVNIDRLLNIIECENYDTYSLCYAKAKHKEPSIIHMYAKSMQEYRDQVDTIFEVLNAESKRHKAYQAYRSLNKWMEKQKWERLATEEMMEQFEKFIFEDEKELEYSWVTNYLNNHMKRIGKK